MGAKILSAALSWGSVGREQAKMPTSQSFSIWGLSVYFKNCGEVRFLIYPSGYLPPQPFLSSPLQVTSMSLKGIPLSEPVFAVTAQEMGPRRASIHESHRTMATTEAVLPQLATQRSAQWEQAKMPISLSFLERGPSAYFKRYHVKVRLPI